MTYRPSIGPDSLRDDLRATVAGDWEEPSGESRLNVMQNFYPAITGQCTTEHYEANGWGGVAPRIERTPVFGSADETFRAGVPGVGGR